ncbi:siderophore-interacting protein [Antrihabitans sp. YC2-6]|uniref:siderophore-interacting protein n=1 Tax=Antrihabitans sp. YC2-6 TaxID=2799498 RepID=UPI0018F54100|nr:siderophore-interacting protein [Antrihabitans sp. YC2-6]MBJ8343285.1 siderophore-interacting protein [Antrihabitans sp. YC2-6]
MARSRTTLVVLCTAQLSSHMVRVHLGGPGFDAFAPSTFTDSYVKLVFPTASGEVMRTYTVRAVDVEARELAIDFVVHGDEGIAGPWAAAAQPGAVIDVLGPGGSYSPRVDADWHLLAGDESALPAIAAALEALAPGSRAKVFVEIGDRRDAVELQSAGDVDLTWIVRDADPSASGLALAVRQLEWLPGRVHVFVHGEAQTVMHDLRRYVRKEKGVTAEWASISGYWRRGRTEEGFRVWKSELAAAESAA